MRTSEVTECAPSFTLPEAAMCECSSMIPDVRNLPLPSTTVAVGDDNDLPILTIFPALNQTSVSVKIPSCSFVQTVAFLIITSCCCGISIKP